MKHKGSRAESTQFIVLISINLRSILLYNCHPNFDQAFLKVCFLQVYLFESTPNFFHLGYMICPSQSSRLNHSNYTRCPLQTMNFLILESSPFSSLFGPNIHLRILFSYTLYLLSSLNLRGHAPLPFSITGNIIV